MRADHWKPSSSCGQQISYIKIFSQSCWQVWLPISWGITVIWNVFSSSYWENTCDVPKPEHDSKGLLSKTKGWIFHHWNSDTQRTKIHNIHFGISWQLQMLWKNATSGSPQGGDDPAARQYRSSSSASPPLHTESANGPQALEIKLPKALPGTVAWQTWVTASPCHGAPWSYRFHGTMWT